LASQFNDNDSREQAVLPPAPHRAQADDAAAQTTVLTTPEPTTPLVSEAVIKFRSCRWRRPPDEGVECCGHRDVLPIAGTNSFDPDAWCPECTFFKLRRSPKKRTFY
jgi:hypothetical protein